MTPTLKRILTLIVGKCLDAQCHRRYRRVACATNLMVKQYGLDAALVVARRAMSQAGAG